jgi:hypothetical protein
MANSFYDLDYIIDLNEKRVIEYSVAYQKVQERLTNIILLYSGIAIYLVPIIQDIIQLEVKSDWLYITFIIFFVLFSVSLFFTVRLIIPVRIADLDFPTKYYKTIRLAYEQSNPTSPQDDIDKLIKVSYIDELEGAVNNNYNVFIEKRSFYYNALIYGLASIIPYLICVGFHVAKKDDKIQKVQIVNSKNISNLDKKIGYVKDSICTRGNNQVRNNHFNNYDNHDTTARAKGDGGHRSN